MDQVGCIARRAEDLGFSLRPLLEEKSGASVCGKIVACGEALQYSASAFHSEMPLSDMNAG